VAASSARRRYDSFCSNGSAATLNSSANGTPLSTQLHQLELSLGQKLFRRSGRRLELTEAGRTVFRYAEQIFSLGREMTDVLKSGEVATGSKFVVGVADAMPKLMVRRLLEPALQLSSDLRLVCVEHDLGTLLTDLGRQSLDLVLADSPLIRGEFDDKALLKAFGQTGEGLFPGTLAIADEICRQYEVELAGELEGVVEHFYAISVERRIRHPAVLAISSSAKSTIFV